MTTQVVEKKKAGLPANLISEMATDSGLGLSNVTADDMQIPFLRILQALSPQLVKTNSDYIKGAEQGDIFNTVTHQVWKADEGIVVVPCYFEQKLLEFVPRSQGGGFVQELPKNHPDVLNVQRDKETNMDILPSGNELVRTGQHYVKILNEELGMLEPAIIDMKKTQIRRSKIWVTQMSMQTIKLQDGTSKPAPMFANKWKLKTVADGNDKGSWYSWQIEKVGMVDSMDMYNECKEFHNSVASGEIKATAVADEIDQAPSVDTDEAPF